MKILRIGILNLNSLRGEQTVDFTKSPLADHRLYAIVGPTGSGKTTILDAITLALYGQTERNKGEKDRKNGSGSVMTYGEGECRAELEYETADGRYRSVWTRQRAHKKPDRDLTASRREINKWNPETEEWDMLANKKRDVDAKTEEVVGLDYERFVRSVMLTQGDFARFLKSDPGDKAAILEKITGTEIYQEISIGAFARAKQAREAWEQATAALSTNLPLTAEERRALDAENADQQAAIQPLRRELKRVTEQLQLHDNLRVLRRKASEHEAARVALEATWTAFANDLRRLTRSEALQPLRPDLDAEHRLAAEERELTAQLKQADQQTEQSRKAVAAAKEAVVDVQDKLNLYYEKLPGREEKFAAVAALEREITTLLRDTELDLKRKLSLDDSLRTQNTKLRSLTDAVTTGRKALAGLEPADLQRRLAELDGLVPRLTTRLESLTRRLARRRTLDRLAAEQAAGEKVAKELSAVTTALADAEKSLAAADVNLADRRTILTNLRVSQSLAAHKTDLAPGEECPVCGATEHPGLEDFVPVTDSAVARATTDANQALTAQDAAKRTLETVRTKEVSLRRKDDALRAVRAELLQQLGDDTNPEPKTVTELAAEQTSVTEQLSAATAEQGRLRRLQTTLPGLTAAETELAGVRQRIGELEAELSTVTGTLDQATDAIERKQAKIRAEVGDLTAEQCRELTRQQKEKLNARLAAAEKAEGDARNEAGQVTARRTVLRERFATVQTELATVRARLAGQLEPGATSIADARNTLLSETETSHLRQRKNELSNQRAATASAGETLTAETAAARRALEDVPARETLEKDRAERENAVSAADRRIGALALRVKQDDERIAAVAEQQKSIAGLRRETDRWQRLSDLIGSADGKKFRSYAQAITLQQLIAIGNEHLENINPRYQMAYEPPAPGGTERLDMIITDRYQNDNQRTMWTLSGGETFLISLALALGLSDLASGKSLIQSLFIDEGFGTLDSKTLDQAMTTLEQLQAQGKTIGLISHVPALRERIYCQLQLKRVGDGYSRIEVQG